MLGAIRKRDLLAHPVVTIRSFGWRVFLKALMAGPNQTFLAILMETQVLPATLPEAPELIGRCAELERTAQRIYGALAERFADRQPLHKFLLTLSRQEQGHAELLEVCRAALRRGRFDEQRFAPWREAVPRLERELRRRESSLDEVTTPEDALDRVLQIESTEINQIFLGAVGSSDTEFVRRLEVFWNTGQKHLRFLAERISELEPDLAARCQELLEAEIAEWGNGRTRRGVVVSDQ